MKSMPLLLAALILLAPAFAQDRTYAIEELRDEDSKEPSPFSITRVVALTSGLRLFFSTSNIEQVRNLLDSGSLEAQLSDNEAGIATSPSISLGKAVWCNQVNEPVYLAYSDPLPACAGRPPVCIEYYFEVPASLGPGRDLAIGQDPDYLWLVEESGSS